MSFRTIQQEIESGFAAEWGVITPVEYQNVQLDTSAVNEYVSLTIQEGDASQASLGESGDFVINGVVIIAVFTKRDIGTKRSKEIADLIADYFRAKKLTTVRFQVPRGVSVPNKTNWFQYNVTVPFYAYFSL